MKTLNLQLGEDVRPIKDYEEYLVSSFGRVFSIKRGKWLKPGVHSNGYLFVILCKEGQIKTKSVHRLVAEAFLANYSEELQVNHLDENKQNNHVWNLEMCDAKANSNYGTRNQRIAEKLSKQVLCLTNGVIYPSTNEAARQLNLKSGHISACCNGKQKQTGGYTFRYVNEN